MNGRMKKSIVLGIIVGLAIAATLHNYSNYKKEKAVETDESSSITSADHNETTTVTTTAKTTSATTTTITSQTTTTTTSSKVPIKWAKTDVDRVAGEFTIEASQWYWNEEDLPSKFSTSDIPRFFSPVATGVITLHGCDFSINASFNPDAQERDLMVMVYGEAYGKDGAELYGSKITYSENSAQATITGTIDPSAEKLVIKSKSTGRELKTLPVSIGDGNHIELISSNPSVIEFFDKGFSIHSTGKVTISCKVNGKIVAQKDVEVVE